jgi:hypothetical protein
LLAAFLYKPGLGAFSGEVVPGLLSKAFCFRILHVLFSQNRDSLLRECVHPDFQFAPVMPGSRPGPASDDMLT